MVRYTIVTAEETVNPTDTTDNEYAKREVNNGDTPFLLVNTLTLDGTTSLTYTCEQSFDGINWSRVKLVSASATDWTKAYTGNVTTTETVYLYDATATMLIPFVAPFFRFVVTAAGHAGSPTSVVQQGITRVKS